MSGSDWDARIASFTMVLLGICAFVVGYGFLMPSPAVPKPGYEPLAGPAAPVRLVVPSLKIKAPILPIEVNDQRILDPPRNPRDVGWWKRSARPGAAQGQTVLTGHTVHTGGGVMDDLGDLDKGKLVKVVTPKGTMEYATTKVVTWSKSELADRAVEIFAQQRSDTRLVLITCTDWNGSDYDSNIVVFAKPLGVREKAA
jgi:LPXTG-site transpeptidase (sortase) family protein